MIRIRSKQIVVVSCIFLFSLTYRFGFSQVITGDILGTVRDSTGAVVPAANVTLSAMDTGLKWETTSDDAGNYLFAQLQPGRYSVQASKQGFQTAVITNIELLVTQRPRVDITLQVGAVNQRVEVSAGGVQLLETQTSAMGQVVQEKPIVDLPLNGRNFIQLALIAAGVAPTSNYSAAEPWTGQTSITVSAAGNRESNTSYIIDGVETRSPRGLGASVSGPPLMPSRNSKWKPPTSQRNLGALRPWLTPPSRSGSNSLHGTRL